MQDIEEEQRVKKELEEMNRDYVEQHAVHQDKGRQPEGEKPPKVVHSPRVPTRRMDGPSAPDREQPKNPSQVPAPILPPPQPPPLPDPEAQLAAQPQPLPSLTTFEPPPVPQQPMASAQMAQQPIPVLPMAGFDPSSMLLQA